MWIINARYSRVLGSDLLLIFRSIHCTKIVSFSSPLFADQLTRLQTAERAETWSIIFRRLFVVGSRDIIQTVNWKPSRTISSQRRSAAPAAAIGRPFLLTYTSPTFPFFEPRLKARKASGVSYLHSRQWLLTARQPRERAAAIVFHWVTYGTVGPWWWNENKQLHQLARLRTIETNPFYLWQEYFTASSALCLTQTLQIDVTVYGELKKNVCVCDLLFHRINSNLFTGFASGKWNESRN